MEALELRNKIIEIINTSDERFLKMVNALHITYKEEELEEVVAYTVQGIPLTKQQYIKQIKEADTSF